MNIIKNNLYIKKSKNITVKNNKDYLYIENRGDNIETVIIPKIYKYQKNFLKIDFDGDIVEGKGIVAKIINRKKQVVSDLQFKSKYYIKKPTNYGMIAFRISPNTKIKITKFSISEVNEYQEELKKFCKSNIMLMSPRISI